MRFKPTGLVFVLVLGGASSALADPALTTLPVKMREAPTGQARVVQNIPANAQIDLNSCRDAWCYVSWRDLFGYVPARAVEATPYNAGRPAPGYSAPAPAVVVAPVWGWGWGPGWRRW